MKVLLSIKPEFAKKIFDGSKRFEFRKSIFKNKNVNKIIVYASAPVQKVIGEFDIEEIIEENPSTLWLKTQEYSGISKEFFDQYFNVRDKGYAIKISNIRKYDSPLTLQDDFGINFPPQSYIYLQ